MLLFLLRSTKENAFIVRSDFENFGAFIDTDLAPPKNSSGANDVIAIDHVLQPRLEFVIDTSLKYLSKHREPLSPLESEKPEQEATFWSEKKKLNGNIFVEHFSRDLDEKMTSASYKRERNKNKAAPCGADNLFKLLTSCPSSRTG